MFIINFIFICSKVPHICSKVPLTWGRFEQNRRIFKNIKASLIFNENVQFCYYMLDKYVINAVRCLQWKIYNFLILIYHVFQKLFEGAPLSPTYYLKPILNFDKLFYTCCLSLPLFYTVCFNFRSYHLIQFFILFW